MTTETEINKIKATRKQLVFGGSKKHPYFSIQYVDAKNGECYQGFGSYNINFVFDWFEECFEMVEESKPDKSTTEINTDYYNELKAKADKWDEKETPLKPKQDKYFDNRCPKCGGLVENEYGIIFDYCPECGQRIGEESEE